MTVLCYLKGFYGTTVCVCMVQHYIESMHIKTQVPTACYQGHTSNSSSPRHVREGLNVGAGNRPNHGRTPREQQIRGNMKAQRRTRRCKTNSINYHTSWQVAACIMASKALCRISDSCLSFSGTSFTTDYNHQQRREHDIENYNY